MESVALHNDAPPLYLALLDEAGEGRMKCLYTNRPAAGADANLRRGGCDGREAAGVYKGGLAPHKLRRLLGMIEENLEGDLTLAQLAGAVGLNPFHLARSFKQATGLAPHQFVMRRRVDEARRLLSRTRLPIVEISLRVGFSSQSHFTKVFRRLTGVTPGTYRHAC